MSQAFVDRRQVGRRFSRAAANYDQADFLVREVDRRMQERLDYVNIQPARIVDLGCSRGGSFAGADPTLAPQSGETMAQTRARLTCQLTDLQLALCELYEGGGV